MLLTFTNEFKTDIGPLAHNVSFWIQKLIHNVSFWMVNQKLTFYVSFWVQKLMFYVSFWIQKLIHNNSFWLLSHFPSHSILGLLAKSISAVYSYLNNLSSPNPPSPHPTSTQ